ncbi:MAG: hypothetical protein SF097_24345 [Acidobacteriota bacterium]|nr:hypothetical protein [Acidobacteriota bacterium]
MNFPNFQRALKKINLRAAGALLIFLLSWIAVPASMLVEHSAEEFCSMECCVADGHCCCAASKPFVEGKDYSDIPKLALPELTSQCPCPATPPSSSKIARGQIAQTHSRHLAVAEHSLPIYYREVTFYRSPQLSPNSSRAPPADLFRP